jgi:hypothetical protein
VIAYLIRHSRSPADKPVRRLAKDLESLGAEERPRSAGRELKVRRNDTKMDPMKIHAVLASLAMRLDADGASRTSEMLGSMSHNHPLRCVSEH